ncbi:helix-turn-helix domain-containing protein [bacterium]|nr:helix-turn-helix domain-containing protein [bacterium]
MSIHPEKKPTASGSTLLTPQENTICKQIATRETPHRERALALLALQVGSSQAQAAEQSGLSAGQVKYWSAKFRKQRLGIFPEELRAQLKTKAVVEPVTAIEEATQSIPTKMESATDDSKDTKAAKEKKMTKKARKEKKAKKIKKSKKDKKEKRSKKDKKNKKSKKSKKSKKK